MHTGGSPRDAILSTGLVEGFYGAPWSREERTAVIPFLASIGMSFYIYAPKDDARHRERWRDACGADEERHFRDLAAACRRHGVAFNFALSPGLSIGYGSTADRSALLEKYLAAADLGASEFSLFLDDIPPVLKEGADRQAFGAFARAQADLANDLLAGLNSRLGRGVRLLFCPTEYAGTVPSPYLDCLGKELDARIPVFWTGPEVVSPAISRADARTFAALIGRKPFLWDNYPVNDFAPNRLFLGPLRGREEGLEEELSGYAANPMVQARASRIALRSIADRFAGKGGYEPERSFDGAVRSVWREEAQGTEAEGDLALEEAFFLVAAQFAPSRLDAVGTPPLSRTAGVEEREAARLGEAAESLLRRGETLPLVSEIAGWLRDVLFRCRALRGSRRATALRNAGDEEGARREAEEAWNDRKRVARRHTLASGETMRLVDDALLPILRPAGSILFASGEECGKACGEERRAILDAGVALEASHILVLFGRPWRIDPPDTPPVVALSLDGEHFEPVALRPAGDGFVANVAGTPFRYMQVAGPAGHHVCALLGKARPATEPEGKESCAR